MFSRRLKNLLISTVLLAPALGFAAPSEDSLSRAPHLADLAGLAEAFRNAESLPRPWAYWNWISGNVTKEGIEKDFEGFKKAGLGGVILMNAGMRTPSGPLRYHSEEWFEHVRFSIGKAAECGMSFSIFNCDGWSEAGGPWIAPERSMKKIVFSEVSARGADVSISLPKPDGIKEDFYRDIEVFVLPAGGVYKTDELICASDKMDAQGNFRASLPEGDWLILRMGYTSTGEKNRPAQAEGRGLEVDKLCADSVRFHLESALGRVIADSKEHVGKTFRGILIDSWEVGGQDWTEKMPEIFKAERGYDLKPFLPALAGKTANSKRESEAFRADFRRAVSAGIAKNFYRQARAFSNENGLLLLGEPYRGHTFNEAEAAAELDVVMSEFLEGGEGDLRDAFLPAFAKGFAEANKVSCVKKISGAAHAAGKRICAAEAFTARKEQARRFKTPADLKPSADAAFASGMNFVVLHTSVHQPYEYKPGFMLSYYGTHFNRHNTWWHQARGWLDYLSRCQLMLQSGRPHADVLYLRGAEHDRLAPFVPLVLDGHDYTPVLPSQFERAQIGEGRVILGSGQNFSAIVTQRDWRADLRTLEKLKLARAAGVPIFGFAPGAPDNLGDEAGKLRQWKALAGELFTPQNEYADMPGLGKMLEGAGLERDFLFEDLGAPKKGPKDFCIAAAHRSLADADIYFVANLNAHAEKFRAKFKSARASAQIWDAVSGEIFRARGVKKSAAFTELEMALPPKGSAFVVFSDSEVPGADSGGLVLARSAEIRPEKWRAEFESPFGERFEISVAQPEDLSASNDARVKYFSGRVKYSCRFSPGAAALEKCAAARLALPQVFGLARARLNGKDLGLRWTQPFEFDLLGALAPGENELEIEVITSWFNRMVGDERLPQDLKYDLSGPLYNSGRLAEFPAWWGSPALEAERPRKTFATWKLYDMNDEPEKSGLAGVPRLNFYTSENFE